MGDASLLLFSLHVVSSSLRGTPSRDLLGAQIVPSHPFCGLRATQSGQKAIKTYGFSTFSWCSFSTFLEALDLQNAFQGALWGAIGKCTGPPGSLQEGLQVFGTPPQDAPKAPQGARLSSQSTPGATLSPPKDPKIPQ